MLNIKKYSILIAIGFSSFALSMENFEENKKRRKVYVKCSSPSNYDNSEIQDELHLINAVFNLNDLNKEEFLKAYVDKSFKNKGIISLLRFAFYGNIFDCGLNDQKKYFLSRMLFFAVKNDIPEIFDLIIKGDKSFADIQIGSYIDLALKNNSQKMLVFLKKLENQSFKEIDNLFQDLSIDSNIRKKIKRN